MPGNSTATLWMIAVYLAVLLVFGLLGFLRSRRGEEDYYLAGRRQGWIVSSLTIMATFFSAFALLGAPGKVYTEGTVFALFALNVPLSGACVYLLGARISRLGRAHGYVTPGDMIADHYGGHAIRILVAVTCMLYVVPYVVIQIQAGGLLFEGLIPGAIFEGVSNFAVGAVTLATITTLYIMLGGMRSVAWTDVFQGLLLMSGMLLGGFVVVHALGGLKGFSEAVNGLPREYLVAPGAKDGDYTPLFLLSVCLFASTGTMVSPAQWMRYYSADSEKTLKRSALIFGIVLTACFLFGVMLVGLGGRALYPDGAVNGVAFNSDSILVVVLSNQLPALWPAVGPWLSSLLILAIAAASMSTADSNLHALSAILTRDVHDRYIAPRASERRRTWVGRGVILAATAISLVIVVGASAESGENAESSSMLDSFMEMIADIAFLAIGFSMQLLPITIDLLWLRRGSRPGACLGLLAGLVLTAVLRNNMVFGFELPLKLMTGVWALLANAAIFAAVSAMFPARRRQEGDGAVGESRRGLETAP